MGKRIHTHPPPQSRIVNSSPKIIGAAAELTFPIFSVEPVAVRPANSGFRVSKKAAIWEGEGQDLIGCFWAGKVVILFS